MYSGESGLFHDHFFKRSKVDFYLCHFLSAEEYCYVVFISTTPYLTLHF